jgi:hypothetical protein
MPIIINLTVVNADWKEVWCNAVKRIGPLLISHRYKYRQAVFIFCYLRHFCITQQAVLACY